MRTQFHSRYRVSASLLFAIALFLSSHPAQAWWNKEWTIRKRIDIDTTTAGAPIADPIGTVALLIRLHDGNYKFTEAKEDGSDLRFLAADDKTLLAYHIEKYDALLNEAFVWVKIPDLKPGAKTSIYMYYGNAGSKATRADDPKGTYDVNTSLVYHFAENNAPPHDSTTFSNNAEKPGVPVAGSLIGPGTRFDGTNSITDAELGVSNLGELRDHDLVGLDQAGRGAVQCDHFHPARRFREVHHRDRQRDRLCGRQRPAVPGRAKPRAGQLASGCGHRDCLGTHSIYRWAKLPRPCPSASRPCRRP